MDFARKLEKILDSLGVEPDMRRKIVLPPSQRHCSTSRSLSA